MGRHLTAKDAPPAAPIDWAATKAEILSRLDVAAEYEALGVRFARPTPKADGWRPCHAAGRRDEVPSAAVHVGTGIYKDSGGEGEVLGFWDFALRHGEFGRYLDVLRHYAEEAGVDLGGVPTHGKGRLREAVYEYRDEAGAVRYAVFRYRLPNGKKSFTQHPPDGRGGWKYGPGCMDGIEPLPYRLPELLARPEHLVFVVEGEKDADRLAALGAVATTNHQGAQSTDRTWPRFLRHFAGRACVVIPDNDPGGRAHARKVASYLSSVARVVHLLELPGLPPKGDVSDWLDLGHSVDELADLVDHSLPFDPGAPAVPGAEEGPGDDLPPDGDVITVRLSDVEAVPLEWLWPDRVPLKKVTLFAGEAKMGKSFLTMDFAARVTTGGLIPCGGGECMPTGSVVLLSAEDDLDDTIKPRLVAAGADSSKVLALTTVRDSDGRLTPFTLAYIPHLERAILRAGDCRLVIIDPIQQYIGSATDDHKAAQLRVVLGPLKDLASRRSVAIVIVHHLNKGNSGKALHRVSGSGAYTALARCNWLICKDAEDPKRRLFLSAGTNLVEEPSGLAYRIDRDTYRIAWEDRPVLMSADEALSAEKEGQERDRREANPSRVEQAEAWLAALFDSAGINLPSDEVFRQGEGKGFSRKVLFEAKARLGIQARKEGFQGHWVWCPPPKESPAPGGNGNGDSLHSLHPLGDPDDPF